VASRNGPGSVPEPPHLPAGFWKTFTSRYVDAGGLRQHVVIGSDGPPLLVRGREDIYFGYEFAIHAGTKQLPGYAVRYYIDNLASDPGVLRGSSGWYRALDTTTAQNQQRSTRKLTLPVLAIGGAESLGTGPAETVKLAADNVRTLVIPGSGHWVMEQAREEMLAALTAFLAPYQAARNARPQATRV
jgi:pimeloyl-ACP methyl ester carboxylesterase